MSTAILAPEIRCILEAAIIEGNKLRIPMTLDRADYVAVNKALEAIGGKWSRKEQAHVFASDPTDKVKGLYDGGKVPAKNPLAFFATPPEIVREMIDLACLPAASQTSKATTILEPSAGDGAIVRGLKLVREVRLAIQTVELDRDRAITLDNLCVTVSCVDFLTWTPPADRKTGEPVQYDRVLMNPPFAVEGDKLAYISHVRRAFTFLKPGGRLVAVVPAGVDFRSDRKTALFRSWVEEHGTITSLDAYSFKVSGTGVNTCLIVVDKPAAKIVEAPKSAPKKTTRKPKAAKVEPIAEVVEVAAQVEPVAVIEATPEVEPVPVVVLTELKATLALFHTALKNRETYKTKMIGDRCEGGLGKRFKTHSELSAESVRKHARYLRIQAAILRSKGINPTALFKTLRKGLPRVFTVKPVVAPRRKPLDLVPVVAPAPVVAQFALPAPTVALKALPAPARLTLPAPIIKALTTPVAKPKATRKPEPVGPIRRPVSIADYAPIRPTGEPACFQDDRPFALVSGPKGPVKKATAERRSDLPGQRWMF